MIVFMTKYRVPQSFLYKIGDLACLYALFGYTSLSDDGSMVLPPEVKASDGIATMQHFLAASKRAFPEIVLHHRGRTFSVPWNVTDELMEALIPAVLKVGEGDIPRDVNMLLHAVDHARKLIL